MEPVTWLTSATGSPVTWWTSVAFSRLVYGLPNRSAGMWIMMGW